MKRPELSPPIYGIETEYTCMLTLPGNKTCEIVGACHSSDVNLKLYEEPELCSMIDIDQDYVNEILKDKLDIIRGKWGMLSNGGRLYFDPSGIEYATAETSSAEDAVMRSFEGDIIVAKLLRELQAREKVEDFQINRRIVDHNRTSRGIHLNTVTSLPKLSREDENNEYYSYLAALNVAKGAVFGSGGLLINEFGETEFHHSPRLSVTDSKQSDYNKYTKRPLVRYPFKDDFGKLRRIETVTGDALNFAWPIKASLVATNAVVGLLELRQKSNLPKIINKRPVGSALDVGLNGHSGVIYFEHKDKPHHEKSLDVMKRIGEVVLSVDDKLGYLDDESRKTMDEIMDITDKMVNDPFSVIDQVESMARLTSMKRKIDKNEISLDSEQMCRFDYAWDLVGGGIAENLRKKGLVGWLGFGRKPSISQIKKRISTPPPNTRAKIRSDLIGVGVHNQSASWYKIMTEQGQSEELHPLATEVTISLDTSSNNQKYSIDEL